MSCQIKIYVPSTVNVNEKIDNSEWVDKSLKFLSSEFGGATASKALGAWVSNSGSLVKEDVTLVFAYADQGKLEMSIDRIYMYCLNMKKQLSQEAIALEINGEMYLI